ncbi:MAG TPA: hypothetical protein VFH94_03450 [Streptomyces sp.]|nr:hypothetical protein [Streptomyces sp.]
MAGDRFTQIANGLFRDGRMSFRAKGLFGLISTHRDGWHLTVAELARRGREGEGAVTAGLRELERHGFLHRDRDRNPDGTLGPAAYFITDLPALQSTRSQPESDYPGLAEPTLADPGTKKTIVKKTNQQNTRPLPPRGRDAAAHTHAPTGPEDATAPALPPPALPPLAPSPPADGLPPGIRLLLEIGASRPELLLTGRALTDQGRVASVMMDAGWSPAQLRRLIAGRPLPAPVRTSVGAIIAARLRAARAYPPARPADHHDQHERPATAPAVRSSTAAAARTVSQALTRRVLVECAGCGRPGTVPGEDLCPSCLDWPLCHTCCGPTPRRAHPQGDGRCTTCALADDSEGVSP